MSKKEQARKRITITLNESTVDALDKVAEDRGSAVAGVASWIIESAVKSPDYSGIESAMAVIRPEASKKDALAEMCDQIVLHIMKPNHSLLDKDFKDTLIKYKALRGLE